jgi:hypothetical protein
MRALPRGGCEGSHATPMCRTFAAHRITGGRLTHLYCTLEQVFYSCVQCLLAGSPVTLLARGGVYGFTRGFTYGFVSR